MARLSFNLDGYYSIKYYCNKKIKREKINGPTTIEADNNSKVTLSIYDEDSVLKTIIKNAFLGFIMIFLICIPSFNKMYYKKYFFACGKEDLNIILENDKIQINNVKFKTMHMDYLFDILSVLFMFIILGLIIYLAIIFHWFEN